MKGQAGVSNREAAILGGAINAPGALSDHLGPDPGGLTELRLAGHLALLLEHNRQYNLTGLKTAEAMVSELFGDSICLVRWLEERGLAGPLVDVGSGAGFPGLVHGAMRPDVPVTLIEATGKKARFLETVREALELKQVRVLHGRSEQLARRPELRGTFPLATARGVASLPALLELTLPFLEVGGSLVAVKGPGVRAEIKAASRALEALGARIAVVHEPPGRPSTRFLQVVLERPVPEAYPRRPGVPAAKPL